MHNNWAIYLHSYKDWFPFGTTTQSILLLYTKSVMCTLMKKKDILVLYSTELTQTLSRHDAAVQLLLS